MLGVRLLLQLCGHCFPKAIKDACGIFVSREGLKVPKDLLSVLPLTFPTSHHPTQCRVWPAPPLFPYRSHSRPSFFIPTLLPFSRMPDIAPSTPGGGGAQPLLQSTTSSINAQFLNAVTRGDEQYARSLLARGADVNATDATGRSSVACVLAGERCAAARVSG